MRGGSSRAHEPNLFWISTNPPVEVTHFWHTRELLSVVVTHRQLHKQSVTTLKFGIFSCLGLVFFGGGCLWTDEGACAVGLIRTLFP